MSEPKPIYIVGSPTGRLAAVADTLGAAAELVPDTGAPEALRERSPGVVVLDAETLSAGQLLEGLAALSGEGWTVAVVTADEPSRLRAVSLGPPEDLQEVAGYADDPDSSPGCLLNLDRALVEIARTRHDVNNPLTAAMAEAQLLLMDAPEGEERESLEAIVQQLRRMRDMVGATRHLRPRRD